LIEGATHASQMDVSHTMAKLQEARIKEKELMEEAENQKDKVVDENFDEVRQDRS
jgi:hypothetical protein